MGLTELPGKERKIYREQYCQRNSIKRKFPRAPEKQEYENWKDILVLTRTNAKRPRPRHIQHCEISDTKDKKETKCFQKKRLKIKIKVSHPQNGQIWKYDANSFRHTMAQKNLFPVTLSLYFKEGDML